MDRIKYDYNVVDPAFPNIFKEDHKGMDTTHRVDFGVNWRFLTALSKARPQWVFTMSGYSGSNTEVWYDREMIGEINYKGDNTFSYTSRSIRNSRKRGNYAFTKDPKKALKAVLENFVPTPTEVRRRERTQQALSDLSQRSGASTNLTRNWIYGQHDALAEFAYTHYDFVSQHIKLPVDFREKYETRNTWHAVAGDPKRHLYIINQQDGNYDLCNPDGVWETFRGDELPDDIAEALGVLKLMDNGSVLANYGYRYDADTFIIVPKGDST